MDQKTKELRRRNIAERGKKGDNTSLAYVEPRGQGRKAKSSTTFPVRICEFKDGGKEVLGKKLAENKRTHKKTYVFFKFIDGGVPCRNAAAARIPNATPPYPQYVCLEHLREAKELSTPPPPTETSPRSGVGQNIRKNPKRHRR